MALINKLSAIGNAIRSKTGGTELIPLADMPAVIESIQTGGAIESIEITSNGTYTAPEGIDGYNPITVNVPQDGTPPEEAFNITGSCNYRFSYNSWNWFLDMYGDRLTLSNITDAQAMFYYSNNLANIPFELNFQSNSYIIVTNMFYNCSSLKEIGTIKNLYPSNMNAMFQNCSRLREVPKFENLNLNRMYTYATINCSNMFNHCDSLRSVPEDFLKQIYQPLLTTYTYSVFNGSFSYCYSLDEIRGLNPQTGTITSNMFNNAYRDCSRLKNIIFATQDDGSPYVAKWKSQTIDLTQGIGYASTSYVISNILNYNSGITADKEVTDDASYQALKNDPDWFTQDVAYSRYNHDSAVNTINTLPDTSAYATNIIKFKGAAGSATDGGAINTLTAEEIAVATAKGWTCSFV